MAYPNKHVNKIMKDRFTTILENGELPDVNYSSDGVFYSYSMIPYSIRWAAFAKIVDDELKAIGEEGVFTKKYNKALLGKLQDIVGNIDGQKIIEQDENRFGTWAD